MVVYIRILVHRPFVEKGVLVRNQYWRILLQISHCFEVLTPLCKYAFCWHCYAFSVVNKCLFFVMLMIFKLVIGFNSLCCYIKCLYFVCCSHILGGPCLHCVWPCDLEGICLPSLPKSVTITNKSVYLLYYHYACNPMFYCVLSVVFFNDDH